MINLNEIFLSSDISVTINEELNRCYLNGGKRAETLSFFCIYITTQEGNQARDPRAWFFFFYRKMHPYTSPRQGSLDKACFV